MKSEIKIQVAGSDYRIVYFISSSVFAQRKERAIKTSQMTTFILLNINEILISHLLRSQHTDLR